MKNRFWILLLCTAFFPAAPHISASQTEAKMEFTISMDQPNTHYFHVELRCKGLKGETLDFKLPSWTPGFYRIMDYAKNILNFRVTGEEGKPLSWAKTAKNAWRVRSGQASLVTVSYDAYAFNPAVFDSFLDDTRGFILPAGIFMHVSGETNNPVTVSVKPYREWRQVSTGLDPVEGRRNTYYAPDFDILYDSPILVGNQEILPFEVQGIPHIIAVDNLGPFDRTRFAGDIRRAVEEAVTIIGEIPYRHYTLILMGATGSGGGGLEHLNSTAIMFNNFNLHNPILYKNWLSLVAHEFFHLYNVKRIRPLALGPFDYDRENYTNLLWVSEGFTRYYDDLILKRAGLLTRDEYFERIRGDIARYENIPGHLFQSATESSFDTWTKFFNRGENTANTTISYYDKGAALGVLLDFKIRDETKNRKSLDDVMRTLYQRYYKAMDRGFTDGEFREACESTAGCPLPEIFDAYASTVREVDYAKYFALAGLDIDAIPRELPGAFFGAATEVQDGNLVISSIEWDSPAQHGGLSARDEILALDGIRTGPRTMESILSSKSPGETVRVLFSRRNSIRETEVVLAKKSERSFKITLLANPSPLQAAILKDWLKER